jgi:hypothetical protein
MPTRLPIPAGPARYETIASYLTRLANLHGMPTRELWEPISTPRPGTNRRDVIADRLAVLVGRARVQLARALPELRDPPPDWAAWRHQPQPGCPRCDARHDGGPVQRLLPHHRYVCLRHRYWIGPPDAGQPGSKLDRGLDAIMRAQRDHQRLVRRHGTAAAYDAVLTGYLFCGHLWDHWLEADTAARRRWQQRSETLIPTGTELATFSAARVFAAAYPEAVSLAHVIAAPSWRKMAHGDRDQQQQVLNEIAQRLGRTTTWSSQDSNAITHWMKFDAARPASRPNKTFPDTRDYGTIRPATTSSQSHERHDRSAAWFGAKRRGGTVILHHRHIQPVLVREWSAPMDGITATIAASSTTTDYHYGRNTITAQTAPL